MQYQTAEEWLFIEHLIGHNVRRTRAHDHATVFHRL